jgi:hypothetical protein
MLVLAAVWWAWTLYAWLTSATDVDKGARMGVIVPVMGFESCIATSQTLPCGPVPVSWLALTANGTSCPADPSMPPPPLASAASPAPDDPGGIAPYCSGLNESPPTQTCIAGLNDLRLRTRRRSSPRGARGSEPTSPTGGARARRRVCCPNWIVISQNDLVRP